MPGPFDPLGLYPSKTHTLLGGLLNASYRSRADWNDRFTHWERPASVTEEGTIERAQAHVVEAIADNRWLLDQRVEILPQGSYHNNTNVRKEADIDLRAVHPHLKVDYETDVICEYADRQLGYIDGLSFSEIFVGMRAELFANLSRAFGSGNVTSGTKAFRIKGITGSRAEVDVVPVIRYSYVMWLPNHNRYRALEGIAILSTEGKWTINFPEQHSANGIAKRTNTAHRFKRVVRIMKRLRSDMEDAGVLTVKVPSFLIECLVYCVEDAYFLVESDDRYDRVRRVARRIQELLSNRAAADRLCEINDIKLLFRPNQAWTYEDALTFANEVVTHLGDA